MADIKISQLGEALAVTDNDILPMTASGVTSKVKASTMKSYMVDDLDVSDLHDTTITTPTDDDGLVYNSTTQKWENKQITTKEQWKKNGAYNLCPNENTTQVIDGVTFTVNSDRSVTVNGTCGSTGADFDVPNRNTYNLGIGTYKLVGCPLGGSTSTYMIGGKINGSWVFDSSIDIGNGAIINVTSAINAITIRIKPGTVCNNLLFKPMITTDLNATYDDYVPYAKTNRELTEWTLAENIKSQTSYATGMDSSKFTYSVCKFGKVVTVNFVVQSLAIPSTGWGKTDLVTGLPVTMDGFSPKVAGYSMTNKIKFSFEITSSGTMRLVRDENTATAENLPTYWGMSIVYITA